MPMDGFESSSKMTLGKLADKLNLQGEAREKFFKDNLFDELCPDPENAQLPLNYDKSGNSVRSAKISVKSLAEATGKTEEEIIKLFTQE